MTCKHLKTRKKVDRIEELGTSGFSITDAQYCDLQREPTGLGMGWISACESTPTTGPCWWFAAEHPDSKDHRF
jgi:hypothetical protein